LSGIPASFKLAGHTIRVRIVPPRKWEHGDACEGIWVPDQHLIEIIETAQGTHRQAIFTHELVHALLDTAGYEDLSRDEEHVERVGQLLMQALTTFKARRASRKG
jgi:hypothetical protein